jgi:hypothetical protein
VGEADHSGEVFLDDVPTFFIKMQGEAIWARCFVVLELVQGSEDLFFLDGPVKVKFFGLGNLTGNMLEKGFKKMILVYARGGVQRMEVGGYMFLDLGDVLKGFPLMGFELGNFI